MTTHPFTVSIAMEPVELTVEVPDTVTASQVLDAFVDELQLSTGRLEFCLRDLGVTPDNWDAIDADLANGADIDIEVLG